jgi:c-di-GMP-binding flagellar brake protein YcgR
MSSENEEPLATAEVARGDGRFDVHARLEIVAAMRALADQHALVTAYGAHPSDFIVSTVLAVHPDDDVLVLDFGADRGTTERVIDAGEVRVVAQLDHVRIQFSAAVTGTVQYEDGPAFLARIPLVMQRLQRREYFRVRIPLATPMAALIAPDPAKPQSTVSLRVLDLSCGGIRLTDVPANLGIAEGTVCRRCTITLPQLGMVVCDLRIVRVVRDEAKPGSCLVVGAFVDLPGSGMTLLQRYINRLERARLTRT